MATRGRPITVNVSDNLDYHKIYFKEKVEIIKCFCGGKYTKYREDSHKKTMKHKYYTICRTIENH